MAYSVEDVFKEKEIKYIEYIQVPFVFAIALFAFEGILLVVPLQASMKEPERFIIVENTSYVILTLLFASFGAVGYLAYGKETEAVITLNLPTDSRLSNLITVCLCFSLFVSHALFGRPTFDIFERLIRIPESYSHKSARVLTVVRTLVVRTLCVLATAGLAILIPNFGAVLGLLGSVSGSNYALILPALFHIKIFKTKISLLVYIKNVCIIALGLIVGILGFLTSIGVLEGSSH